MPTSLSIARLRALQSKRTLVRFHRATVEEGHVTGVIAGVSTRLIALSVLSDGLRPNGFSVVRRADVSELLAPDPYAGFANEALRLRGDKLGKLPKLDLTSWHTLVTGAQKRFPLLTLHLELTQPDLCYIGRPVELTARAGTFLTIGPDAEWDRQDLAKLPWRDVTRIDFGGEYEQALALVAGTKAD